MQFTIQDAYHYTKDDVKSINLNNFTSLEEYKSENYYNYITLIEARGIKGIYITDLKNKIGKSLEDLKFNNYFMVWCKLKDDVILEISNKRQSDMRNYIIIYSSKKLDITQRHINRLNRHIIRKVKLTQKNPISYDTRPNSRYYDSKRSPSPLRTIYGKSPSNDDYLDKREGNRSPLPSREYRDRSRSPLPSREYRGRSRSPPHLREYRDRSRSPTHLREYRGRSRSPSHLREYRGRSRNRSPPSRSVGKQPLLFSHNLQGGYSNVYPTNISGGPPPLIYNTLQPQQHIQSIQDLAREKLLIEKELELQKLKTELANERAHNFEQRIKKIRLTKVKN